MQGLKGKQVIILEYDYLQNNLNEITAEIRDAPAYA
jgi:hypothetical protein